LVGRGIYRLPLDWGQVFSLLRTANPVDFFGLRLPAGWQRLRLLAARVVLKSYLRMPSLCCRRIGESIGLGIAQRLVAQLPIFFLHRSKVISLCAFSVTTLVLTQVHDIPDVSPEQGRRGRCRGHQFHSSPVQSSMKTFARSNRLGLKLLTTLIFAGSTFRSSVTRY
jgi:hypothetical protein